MTSRPPKAALAPTTPSGHAQQEPAEPLLGSFAKADERRMAVEQAQAAVVTAVEAARYYQRSEELARSPMATATLVAPASSGFA